MAGKEISYPKDPKLRQAYQGLIKLVLTEDRIKFQTKTCIEAIMDYMELVDDKSTNPKQQSGTNYKRAKNYLKTLRKYVRLVPNAFAIVEIFVFTTDGIRIQTLETLKQICYEDPEMCREIDTFKDFNYDQPWLDRPKEVDITDTRRFAVSAELARIDENIKMKKSTIAAAPKQERHSGIFKGKKDPEAARKAVIQATRKLQKEKKEVLEKEPGEEQKGVIKTDDIYNRNPQSEFA